VRADVGESKESVMAAGLDARVRHFGVEKSDADNPLLSTAFGRLYVAGGIAKSQLEAGKRFARIQAAMSVLDDTRPGYGCPLLARIACASGSDPYDRLDPELAWDETDARRRRDIIDRIRRDASELTSALWEMEGRLETRGASYAMSRVILWDDASLLQSAEHLGVLRCGLNILARMWGFTKA
jgi:hypothetical protein